LSYSQEIYPKLTEINGDTVVLLSIWQVTSINETYEQNKALKQKINVLDSAYNRQALYSSQKDSLIIQKQQSIEIILGKNRKIVEDNDKLRKQRKWFVGLGAVGGLVIGLLIN
jgi:ElaB/YqjD/DUF883 family membrane-anchored ribosome-binding protein